MVHVNRFPGGKGNLKEAGEKALPYLYFSDHWDWEPYNTIRPRWENWGGQLLALFAVFIYVGWWCDDRLARNMAIWGFIAGGIGFPAGQSVQAYYQWYPEVFQEGVLKWIMGHLSINPWNTMETTFGTVMGGIVGLGIWFNRRKIGGLISHDTPRRYISMPVELLFVAIHVACLAYFEFYFVAHSDHYNDALYEQGLVMAFIPFALIVGGRFTHYLVLFPIVLQSIAGKTLRDKVYTQLHHEDGTRERVYNETANLNLPFVSEPWHLSENVGWALYFVIPMTIALLAAIYFFIRHRHRSSDTRFPGVALLLMGWMFFYLNFAFWGYPWWELKDWAKLPWNWEKWGGPNTMNAIFVVYMTSLTCMVWRGMRRDANDSKLMADSWQSAVEVSVDQ
jgi:hypothetical protein